MKAFRKQIARGAIFRWLSLFVVAFCLLACNNVNDENSIYPIITRDSLVLEDKCPAPDAENISIRAIITLEFSKTLDPATVTSSALIVGSGAKLVEGNIYCDDNLVTFIPMEPFRSNSHYRVYITSDLRDEDGFAYTNELSVYDFYTGAESGNTCR